MAPRKRRSSSPIVSPLGTGNLKSRGSALTPVTVEDFGTTPSPFVRPVDGPIGPKEGKIDSFKSWFTREARYAPARLALGVFALIIATITALLSLPFATVPERPIAFVDVLFTAVSAVCVTGLTTIDTASSWTIFGQAVIALGIMIGGLGVMTLASILGFAVSRHLGLTQRMLAAQETKSDGLGQITGLLKAVFTASLSAEALLAILFFPRFLTLGHAPLSAAWQAVFMAISVFNNAGFVIMVEGLSPHVTDGWMLIPITLGTFIGAIGFPVIQDLNAHWRTPRKWALHTKLTLSVYLILALIGSVMLPLTEWTNPRRPRHPLEDPQCAPRRRELAFFGPIGSRCRIDAPPDPLRARHPHDDRRRFSLDCRRCESHDLRGPRPRGHRRSPGRSGH